MGLPEIIGFTVLTLGSAISGIIYALKHVKNCKCFGFYCQQDTISSINNNDEENNKFPSPLSTTKLFMKKQKNTGAKPVAFMPNSTPRPSESPPL